MPHAPSRVAFSLWVALTATLACGGDRTARSADVAVRADSVLPEASPSGPLSVDTVARGLEIPWGLAFAPDGRLFVTERPGRLRVITADGLRAAPLLTLDVHATDPDWHPESGLMGIALAPDFATSGRLYLLATFQPARDAARAAGSDADDQPPFENRIVRVTLVGDAVRDTLTIARAMWTDHYHAGGALAFGPDGMLYASIGDGRRPARARSAALAGAVLRFTPEGGIPRDNPDPTSPVWARGLRNVQGLAWLPDTRLLVTDHGPTGMDTERGWSGRDELNVIVPGADYGWPEAAGRDGAEGYTRPVWTWERAVAPAALTYYAGEHLRGHAPWRGSLFVGRLRGGVERLTVVTDLQDGTLRLTGREMLPIPDVGRVRAVMEGPDGGLYVTTSNRDIRGTARPGDDLVLRIHPADTSTASDRVR